MEHTLSFRNKAEYPSTSRGITLAVILRHGERECKLAAKLDTGAESCIFNRDHGEALGLTIEDGEPKDFFTATGGKIPAFGHRVTVYTMGTEVNDALVFFAKDPGFPRDVLGRHGWLTVLRLGLVDHDCQLYLSHYNDPSD